MCVYNLEFRIKIVAAITLFFNGNPNKDMTKTSKSVLRMV